jgi:hypothetical protein
MRKTIAAFCLLMTPLSAIGSSRAADDADVIVSGANVFPVVYEPLQKTACKSLALPGTYRYYRRLGDGRGNSGPGVLVSTVKVRRVPGNPGVFSATERKVSGSLPGFLQTPYIQLWQFNGCTLIFAKNAREPLFVGSHDRIADPKRIIFYGFAGETSELRRL